MPQNLFPEKKRKTGAYITFVMPARRRLTQKHTHTLALDVTSDLMIISRASRTNVFSSLKTRNSQQSVQRWRNTPWRATYEGKYS